MSPILLRLKVILSVCAGCAGLVLASCVSGGATAGGTGGTGGTGGAPSTELPATLGFEPAVTLLSAPGQQHTLTVLATPPRGYVVRLALQGDFQDGSLDRGEVITGSDGRASFELVAPTYPTTFSVQASVGDQVFAKRAVSVSSSGFATLEVVPSYSGKRPVGGWVASARTGTTCSGLTGNPPEDGDLIGESAAGQAPEIHGVPLGPPLAITLRSGFYLSGCKDVKSLSADSINQVQVTVTDVPIKLGQTDLQLSLDFGAPQLPWDSVFATTIALAKASVRDGAVDDVEALLDAMHAGAGAGADEFMQLRAQEAWDDSVRVALGATAESGLSATVGAWLEQSALAITGAQLEAQLVAQGSPTQAFLHLTSFASAPAAEAGLPAQAQTTLAADPGDIVLLGTKLYFVPSRLLGAGALPIAQSALPGATSVAEALAAELSCQQVAATVVGAGGSPVLAYPGCDEPCIAALCEQALETIWLRARDASANAADDVGSLQLSATGTASVDTLARPQSLSGTWVGTLAVGAKSTSVGGGVVAGKPLPPR